MPCSQHQILAADRACNACRFFKGVVGITPVETHWTFKEKTRGPRDVRRVQFPLAPALPKTIYALQGQTCEPGLVCHVALPKKHSEEARWLAYYVMLSCVRDLQSLHLVGKVSRSILEGGPPARLQDAMENLFEKKMEATMAACKAAREELQWPAHTFTRCFVHCFQRIPRHPTLLPQLFLFFWLATQRLRCNRVAKPDGQTLLQYLSLYFDLQRTMLRAARLEPRSRTCKLLHKKTMSREKRERSISRQQWCH